VPGAADPVGPPATPVVLVTVVDTSTWHVTFSAFSGDGADTQDSIAVTVLRSGSADTLFHAVSGVQLVDTVSDNTDLKADTTYRVLGRQKGVEGDWSDADTVDENGIYSEGEFFCTNGCDNSGNGSIALDTDTVYPGLTQSLRYDLSGSGTTTIAPAFGTNKARVWVEFATKFGDGFTVDAATPTGGAGYKFLFVNAVTIPSGGRYALEFENGDAGSLNFYAPNDDFQDSHTQTSQNINSLDDREWHVFRFYVDAPADSMRVWIDGADEGSSADFDVVNQEVYDLRVLNHMNKNVPAQSIWLGYWKVFDTDPGW
jgi:hypothetical protein